MACINACKYHEHFENSAIDDKALCAFLHEMEMGANVNFFCPLLCIRNTNNMSHNVSKKYWMSNKQTNGK